MKTTLFATLLLLAGSAVCARAAAPDPKAIWDDQCVKCHGDNGNGDTKMGKKLEIKDLTDPKIQAAFTDDQAAKAIKDGTKDKNGDPLMKAIDGITDEQIKVLVPFVRTLAKK
jgi:mono/diheme cytochrome c family protein